MASISEREPLLPDVRSSQSTTMLPVNNNMDEGEAVSADVGPSSRADESISTRVNRKMDVALLPFLSLLYLFNGLGKNLPWIRSCLDLTSLVASNSGLDRSNVGNAETQGTSDPRKLIITSIITKLYSGFTTDIGATPDDLNSAVSLFFITFVLLQPPSAAIGRWLGAKYWITIIMASSLILSEDMVLTVL